MNLISISFEEAWEIYKNLAPKTNGSAHAEMDNSRWHKHIKSFFSGLRLTEIKTRHILQFRVHLESQGYMPQTVKHYLGQVRRILKKAVQWELYNGPVPHFEMPKFDNTRYRYLTHDEAARLMQAIAKRSERWHDISLFALATGLRAGEIWRIQKDQISLPDRQIHVMDIKSHRRKITYLPDVAFAIVRKYLNSSNISGYLFESRNGKKIIQVSRSYFLAVEDAGLNCGVTDPLQKVVFHTLRHTFASWLVQEGTPLQVVQQLLGHRTISQTMRYAHLRFDQGVDAIEKLNACLMSANSIS